MPLYLLALTLDRRYGARWNREAWPARSLESVLRLFARIGMRPGKNRIRALLASNGGSERRLGVLIMLIMTVTTSMVILGYKGMRDGSRFGSYGMFPTASPALDPAHYNDLRNPDRSPSVPFVDSMVAPGPYLELVVPYDPRRDGPTLRDDCPQPDGSRGPALLTCLQDLHPILLDGKPVPGLRFEAASDPGTNRPALLAMIDIRTLADGRHELRIARAPPPKASSDDDEKDETDPDMQDYVIPFWK